MLGTLLLSWLPLQNLIAKDLWSKIPVLQFPDKKPKASKD